MREWKAKLKMAGVCVGYERRKRTGKGSRMMLEHRTPEGEWKLLCCGGAAWVGWIDHDEICPFVCLDRNRKEVYEGDVVAERDKQYCVVWEGMGFSMRCLVSDIEIGGKPYFRHEAIVPGDIELLDPAETEGTHVAAADDTLATVERAEPQAEGAEVEL